MKHYIVTKGSTVTIFWYVEELSEEVHLDTSISRDWIILEKELFKHNNRYLYQISSDLVIEIYLDNCVAIESEEIKP